MSILPIIACWNTAAADPAASHLKASARNGQVFLTWKEAETPEGTTFNVYVSDKPITSLKKARKVGHHIERHSARDWWEDPASFRKDAKHADPVGFLVETGGKRLDPTGGLFVHTVAESEKGRLYFAVTTTDPDGKENKKVVRGVNATAGGVQVAPGPITPIWQREGKQPDARGAGKGKGLSLSLHGKGGVIPDMEYLFFGDESMGWREGLPFKFSVRVGGELVHVRPTDRVWINRPHLEAGDAGTPAIWTFWYGYNSKIYDRKLMAEGVPTNYTERRLLWILKWVHEYYQTDPNRCFCSGSSMGGCGTVSFGLHHPEIFAALHAHVPIVSYTNPPSGSARRLAPSCWIGPITREVKTNEGVPLLDRMNGTKFVKETKDDLPFLFIINGRKDASIPWENNPPFYRALNDTRQPFAAYWNDGEHATVAKMLPDDVKEWSKKPPPLSPRRELPSLLQHILEPRPGQRRPARRRHHRLDEPRHGLEGHRGQAQPVRDYDHGFVPRHRVPRHHRHDAPARAEIQGQAGREALRPGGRRPPVRHQGRPHRPFHGEEYRHPLGEGRPSHGPPRGRAVGRRIRRTAERGAKREYSLSDPLLLQR